MLRVLRVWTRLHRGDHVCHRPHQQRHQLTPERHTRI